MAGIYCTCFAAAAPFFLPACDPSQSRSHHSVQTHRFYRSFDTNEPIVPVYRIGQRAHSTQ
ncbi:hypothetical protein PR003_g18112 [Phytophthora rubi]|uniref:Uncharacterized protein n=1 Tax=Phytophthora rubi TaxID=129364 RepID=A0A6A3NUE2_9STRA|nr:hypothetical protein PR002_g23052 [Phytophthora rubi]KAE9049112.1 hypothetical protein PR001_g3565 [Phytophthora rubi]KAE9318943.1 hypothetical protein PR003_g18112 [Phytophthora rubi]